MKPHLVMQQDMAAPSAASTSQWLIVTQYKSDRVVYFTDDPDFDIPPNADWCYVSPHAGDLPEGMTLRNCWGWRYRGFEFIDARRPGPADRAQALLDNNKDALRKLLREKIDALRKPVSPSGALGAQLRAAKLGEAQAVLAGSADGAVLRLLPAAAVARDLSLAEMAQLIIERDRYTRELLERSEALREELAVAIDRATTQDALGVLRNRLLNELAPELGAEEVTKPEHTTPERMAALPTAPQLEQEQLRLRVKLRMKINELRRAYVSDYLLDAEVLRHKASIAEQILTAGGAVPAGLNATPLISHAAGRGQSLMQAATEVVAESREVEAILVDTEQMKDAVLSQLGAVRTFADIKNLGRMIERLRLGPVATAAR